MVKFFNEFDKDNINSYDERLLFLYINSRPERIQYVTNPSENLQKTAICRDESNIRFIKKPSIDIQKYAIDGNVYNIFYIKNLSFEIILHAIKSVLTLKDLRKYIERKRIQVAIKDYCRQINDKRTNN